MDIEWLQNGQAGAAEFRIEADRADGEAGRPVTGALWQSTHLKADTPLILCGHGASGDRYQAPIPHLAKRFLTLGFATLAIDGPVHGLRQQGPGGRAALAEEFKRPSCIDDMVADWSVTLATVRDSLGLVDNPLGYFGLSMGTIFGLPFLAAAQQSGVQFSASVLGLAGTTGAVKFFSERLMNDAARITHPLLYLMQLEDELFPRDGYLTLFDALGASDKRLHANPGLHPELPSEEVDAAFEFLAARMQGPQPRRITNPLSD